MSKASELEIWVSLWVSSTFSFSSLSKLISLSDLFWSVSIVFSVSNFILDSEVGSIVACIIGSVAGSIVGSLVDSVVVPVVISVVVSVDGSIDDFIKLIHNTNIIYNT